MTNTQSMSLVYILYSMSVWVFPSLFAQTLETHPGGFQWTHDSSLVSPGRRLEGPVLEEHGGYHLVTQCAGLCLRTLECGSYSMDRRSHTCRTHPVVTSSSTLEEGVVSDLLEDPDWDYYLRDAFTIHQDALGPCLKQPCVNGGICLTTNSHSYTCVCAEGWTGKHCHVRAPVPTWTEWSPWGQCSATCEAAWQVRMRTCLHRGTQPASTSGGCIGAHLEYRDCIHIPCPGWSDWAEWSNCTTERSCGDGQMDRGRQCIGGDDCKGVTTQTQICQVPSCSVPIRLVDGLHYGEGKVELYDDVTESWGSVCASGFTRETANVVCRQHGLEAAESALSDAAFGEAVSPYLLTEVTCSGTETYLAECDHAPWGVVTRCTHPAAIRCIVNGGWTAWSTWGDCSATCGSSGRTRSRKCSNPPPLGGGKVCPGPETDVELCPAPSCQVDGVYEEWSPWSECSLTCGNGTQTRNRTCDPPQHGGRPCEGPSDEHTQCFTAFCPVDGWFGQWGEWSTCSATCENGTQTRSRNCTAPLNGGSPCEGPPGDSRGCFLTPCPVDGYYSAWGAWSLCGATCGNSTRERTRPCQPAQHGGLRCFDQGPSSQLQACILDPCSAPSEWEAWSPWSLCSVTCGGGARARTRNCTQEDAPSDLCTGDDKESEECHKFDCFPHRRTCSELLEAGLTDSTMVEVDPWSTRFPFWVRCDMHSLEGIGITEIVHNQMGRRLVDGTAEGGHLEVDVKYNVSIEEMELLIDVSENCRQYVSWQCRSWPINSDPSVRSDGLPRVYPLARYGEPIPFWAGGNPDNHYTCACGMNATCAIAGTRCNCDAGDDVLRQDDGFITYKDLLPISRVVTSGSGDDGMVGYLTLGAFQCIGSN